MSDSADHKGGNADQAATGGARRRRIFGSVSPAEVTTETLQAQAAEAEQAGLSREEQDQLSFEEIARAQAEIMAEIEAEHQQLTASIPQTGWAAEGGQHQMSPAELAAEMADLKAWTGATRIPVAARKVMREIPGFMRQQYPNILEMAEDLQKPMQPPARLDPDNYATQYLALGAARWEQYKTESSYQFHRTGQDDGLFTKYHRSGARFRFHPDTLSRDIEQAYRSLKIDRDMLYKSSCGYLHGRITPNKLRQQEERLSLKSKRERAVSLGMRAFLLRGRRMMLR